MFEFAKKLPGIDLSIALLPWIVAVLASALALVFACVEMRGMRRMSAISIVIVCVIAATAVWVRDQLGARDVAAERRALDERAFALKLQGLMPGSALACLEALAPAIQEGCEKALFASPETAAAAAAYVAAQLELLADARKQMQAIGSYPEAIMAVRTALERDQFGIVAHVFVTRRGCRPDHCDLFALLQDTGRVRANIGDSPFEASLALHSLDWTAQGNRPTAGVAGSASSEGAVPVARPPGKLFFPSSSSIPSLNIMTPEPTPSQQPIETTASADMLGRPPKQQERTPQSRQSPAVDSPRSEQGHSGPLQLVPSAQ